MNERVGIVLHKGARLLDFVFGTLPIATPAYCVERLRHMKVTGSPIRAIDVIFRWAGKHWAEGTLNAKKAVAIARCGRYIDGLRSAGIPVTHGALTEQFQTIGLTMPEAVEVVKLCVKRDLVEFVPSVHEFCEDGRIRPVV